MIELWTVVAAVVCVVLGYALNVASERRLTRQLREVIADLIAQNKDLKDRLQAGSLAAYERLKRPEEPPAQRSVEEEVAELEEQLDRAGISDPHGMVRGLDEVM